MQKKNIGKTTNIQKLLVVSSMKGSSTKNLSKLSSEDVDLEGREYFFKHRLKYPLYLM